MSPTSPTATQSPDYFDYNLQAFVLNGKVQDCAHPAHMSRPGRPCCNQRRHAGLRAVDVPGHCEPPILCPSCNCVIYSDDWRADRCPSCAAPRPQATPADPALDAIRAAARYLEDPTNQAPDHETRTKARQIAQALREAERQALETYAATIRQTYGAPQEAATG